MQILPVLVTTFSLAAIAAAEPKQVQFIVIVPDAENAQAPRIFVASSADGWSAAGRPLARVAPGLYSAMLALEPGPLEYKFTRTGAWTTVEKATNGSEIPNRTLMIDTTLSEQVTVHVVERWADRPPAKGRRVELPRIPAAHIPPTTTRASTLTGEIRFHDGFHSPQLKNDRRIVVCLPPGYDDHPDERYPVFYLHDGNNLFDAATSFLGVEWQADETAQRLIGAGRIRPLIIVGIYNNADRASEYTPFRDERRGGGNGDAYLAFIVDTLKPFIDKTYRTRPDREATAIGGSSLGGLISLYAAYK